MKDRLYTAGQWRVLSLVAAIGLLSASCGIGGLLGGGDSSDGSFGTGDNFSVLAALGEVPLSSIEGSSFAEMEVTDLVAAGEAAGVSRPTGSDDRDEIVEWLGPLAGLGESPVFARIPRGLSDSVAETAVVRGELGFGITDVDALVAVTADGHSLVVLAGDVVPILDSEDADGVGTVGSGDDFALDLENSTAARPRGGPLRFGSSRGLIAMGPSTPLVQSWLDPASPRLSDDEALALAAAALDEKSVVSAYLARSDFSDPIIGAEIGVRFDTVGVGSRSNGGSGEIVVVYVMASGGDAAAGAVDIENLWRNGTLAGGEISVSKVAEVIEVETSGRAVIVTLSMPADQQQPNRFVDMIFRREMQFVSP